MLGGCYVIIKQRRPLRHPQLQLTRSLAGARAAAAAAAATAAAAYFDVVENGGGRFRPLSVEVKRDRNPIPRFGCI
eukprot:CAMPEP_0170173886 /NCGR_PEP_ID=MMETSP0040_2-20121228/7153_1 /TAXON_ID=641309 /ORGANISM="Lotharella oceanica, Strain CCMP622" /LENGTH=75 /DNA_ID=CAMNT_0010415289 /DNA_START=135 /DNA_END=362 /DNA_ORIENTATION=-